MKITLYNSPEIEIDPDEVAYQLANGDVAYAGRFILLFCAHMKERELEAGLKEGSHFNTFLAEWLENDNMCPDYLKHIMKILQEIGIES